MKVALSLEEYQQYREQYVGFCRLCQQWTADCVEPDAREYECPACCQRSIYGAAEALLNGLIEIA